MGRLPDWVIVGAMKAGTTTLFDRLGGVPGVSVPSIKEPHFFTSNWGRGVGWYASIFESCAGLAGEASASYADAAHASSVATRMFEVIPNVRLIYLIRNPIDRMRSHYRHEVLRSRERRPFESATADVESPYVTRSLYGSVLGSFLSSYPRDQVLVVRSDWIDEPASWSAILDHLGADRVPLPSTRSNVTADKPQFTPLLLWMWERDLLPDWKLPGWLNRIGRRVLTRPSTEQSPLLRSADAVPGEAVMESIRADQEMMRRVVGDPSLVWAEL